MPFAVTPLGSVDTLASELAGRRQTVRTVVANMARHVFTRKTDAEHTADVVEMYRLDPVVLGEATAGQAEDVTLEARYGAPTRGVRVVVHVPFDGDKVLLTHSATSSTSTSPGALADDENAVLVDYETTRLDPAAFEAWWAGRRAELDAYVRRANADAETWNDELRVLTARHVAARRATESERATFANSISLPRRTTSPDVAPVRRRPVTVATTTATPFARPDPILKEAVYEDILRLLAVVGTAFERTPLTFAQLDEEEIRDFLLVILNATYEGDAVGEAFNKTGKTDILVRRGNANVFAAELKFWDGPASVTGALDQLLGYLSFRDNRAAVVVFVRDRVDTTKAVADCISAVAGHPTVDRRVGDTASTVRADFVVHPAGDPGRTVRIALLPLVVPAVSDATDKAATR